MNEHTITINVTKNIIFSIFSILCAKLPLLVSNTRIAKTNPIIGIGAKSVEWRSVASNPTTIIPIATNEVKYTMTFCELILPHP